MTIMIVTQTSSTDLDPIYFAYQHCKCQPLFYGSVDENGNGCETCQKVIRCLFIDRFFVLKTIFFFVSVCSTVGC